MRKTLASTGTAVLLLGLGVGVTTNAMAGTEGVQAKPDKATALARANTALTAHKAEIKGTASDAYIVKRTIIDDRGSSHVRYDRMHQGLPVRGGDFTLHSDANGRFAGATVAQPAPIQLASVTPTRTSAQAVAAAKRGFVGKFTSVKSSTLIVDATKAPRLAWHVQLEGWQADGQTPSKDNVIIDASTGAVLDRWNTIEQHLAPGAGNAAAPAQGAAALVAGTGNSIFSGTVAVDTTLSGSTYTLVDPSHGNANTCNLNNGTSTCVAFTDADNTWGNGTASDKQSAAVDAHYGAALTFDYFKNVHGRNGIFGNGLGAPSRVHYGQNYVNAFWDGTQMTYGDGANNANPLVALDVAGHEMSHGVTEALAALGYSGDVGGLNEATSDIYGSMVEYYANNTNDPGDYDIGEEINIFGNGKPLRYMYNPNLDGQSYNCWSTAVPGSDPHYSSGVGNHLFYLLAEGSTAGPKPSPTCNNSVVTGIGKDKAAKIWYKALDAYYRSTETYKQARADTLKAATDLYGNCSAEYQAVQAAWSAVSVTDVDPPCGTPPPTTPPPTTPPPTGGYFENATDVAIVDFPGAAAVSNIPVSGQAGNASSTLKVAVDIKHTYKGDLLVELVAPDGSAYTLVNRLGGSADNIVQTFTVNASSEVANGVWKLRVTDKALIDVGKIDKWSLQF